MKKVVLVLLMIMAGFATLGQNTNAEKLVDKGFKYVELKKYKKAAKCFEKAIGHLNPETDQEQIANLERLVKRNNWMLKWDKLYDLALKCQKRSDYELSNEYFEQVIQILDSMALDSSEVFIRAVHNRMAENYAFQGIKYGEQKKHKEASECFEKAVEYLDPASDSGIETMLPQLIKTERMMYQLDSLFTLALKCTEEEKYALSNEYLAQALLVLDSKKVDSIKTDDLVPKIHDLIAENYTALSIASLDKYQFDTARSFLISAVKWATSGSITYKSAHRWLGIICEIEATEIKTGIANLERSVALCEEGERHYDTAGAELKKMEIRLLRASKLVGLGRTEEAKVIYNQIVASNNVGDTIGEIKGEAYTCLGELAKEEEEYFVAIQFLEKGYELYEKARNAILAAEIAGNLYRLYNYQLGDKKMAELWNQRQFDQIAIYKRNMSAIEKDSSRFQFVQSRKRSDAMRECVAFYEKIKNGKIDEGIKEGRALAARFEQDADIPLTVKATCYSFISTGEAMKGDFKAAVGDIRHSIRLLESAGVEGKEDLKSAWQGLAIFLWRCKDYEGALLAVDTCVEVAKAYYGSNHEETMDAHLLRGDMNVQRGNKELALEDIELFFNYAHEDIPQNFEHLTKAERIDYWRKYESSMKKMSLYAYELEEYESNYTDVLYNEQLLAKGLILNTESALQRVINENPDLRNDYFRISELHSKANGIQAIPSEVEIAIKDANRIERELVTKAHRIYQFTDFLKVGIEEVKKNLAPDAIGVEFGDFKNEDGKTMLCALVLSQKRNHARFVPLITEEELQLRRSEMGELIWRPILNAAGEGVRDIYFAPTGILHLLPLESASLSNGEYVENDQRNLHRVSSTRWVVPQQNVLKGSGAVVYGGLRYDLTVKEMKNKVQGSFNETDNSKLLALSVPTKGNKRGSDGLDYLKGTQLEAETIAKTMEQYSHGSMKVELLTGARGTEESFKALSGKHKQLIHVGTHGVCDTVTNVADMNEVLNRCGLYFSGADNKLLGESLPDGMEDGFLSASEIAEMDLQGLELVTLSACETGKGNVSGDGVFGLQRGFKKAGARSLLMSLWKVDDRATSVLMTEFYRLWLGGMSMHDALESAKKKVRSTKGWESPEFWAAFILLDGD